MINTNRLPIIGNVLIKTLRTPQITTPSHKLVTALSTTQAVKLKQDSKNHLKTRQFLTLKSKKLSLSGCYLNIDSKHSQQPDNKKYDKYANPDEKQNLQLKSGSIINFNELKYESIFPTVQASLDKLNKILKIISSSGNQESLLELFLALETEEETLNNIRHLIYQLNTTTSNIQLRKASEICLLEINKHFNDIDNNKTLYGFYQKLLTLENLFVFSAKQKIAISKRLISLENNGINLPIEQQKRYNALREKLRKLTSTFGNNAHHATNAWTKLITTAEEIQGLPEDTIIQARTMGNTNGLTGWLLTLKPHCFTSVMTYSNNQYLRKELYIANVSKASKTGPKAGSFDNTSVVYDIVNTRHKLSNLLNLNNYAEKSFQTKSLGMPEIALDFLYDLIEKLKPMMEKDFIELKEFAYKNYNQTEINHWDISYLTEKIKHEKFKISEQKIKKHFPINKVLTGLFKLTNHYFNIQIEEISTQAWHNDIRLFVAKDNNAIIGHIYMDLYERDGKRIGAQTIGQTGKQPIAFVNCNFHKSIEKQQSVLAHGDIIILFHEFGHALNHILSNTGIPSTSGIFNMQMDVVEFASQFMENFAWQKNILKDMSSHIDSGEEISDEILDQVMASRSFHQATKLMRQAGIALFDLVLHKNFISNIDIHALYQEIMQQTSHIPPLDIDYTYHSINHIFSGGYEAGYYSYLWSKVMAVDAFSLFEEQGMDTKEIGKIFRSLFLEQSSTENFMELFKTFRGRAPSIEPLLKQLQLEYS